MIYSLKCCGSRVERAPPLKHLIYRLGLWLITTFSYSLSDFLPRSEQCRWVAYLQGDRSTRRRCGALFKKRGEILLNLCQAFVLNQRTSQLLPGVTQRKALRLTLPSQIGMRQMAARDTDGEKRDKIEAFANGFGRSRRRESRSNRRMGVEEAVGREKMKIQDAQGSCCSTKYQVLRQY